MSAYRINIDGRVYEGHYGSKPDAVYGAMRKDLIDRNHEAWAARQPHKDTCASHQARIDRSWLSQDCDCHALDESYRLGQRLSADQKGPSLIGVEIVTDRKVAKKVHRINPKGLHGHGTEASIIV